MNAQPIMIDRDAIKTELAESGTMSVKAAAAQTGLSKSAIYGLMEAGKLVYVRIGRRRLIPRKALAELIKQNMVMR